MLPIFKRKNQILISIPVIYFTKGEGTEQAADKTN